VVEGSRDPRVSSPGVRPSTSPGQIPLAARGLIAVIRAVPQTVLVTGAVLAVLLLVAGRADAAAAAAVAALLALSVTLRVWFSGRA
jgi:predicted aconitase with swiveling domain